MVDPNRKINRLTEKDIEFLDECEEEFLNRFTEDDAVFMEHCAKPVAEPPIVDNWGYGAVGGHSHRGNSVGQRNPYGGGGGRNNRSWNRRGGSGERNHYRHREQFYDRNNSHGGNRYNDHGRSTGSGERREREHDNRPPMNIRRDYGNFVPASRD